MSGTHARLLLAMVVAAMGISSAAEAHHWRYHHGFYQGTDEDRGEDTALRTFGNYRSRIEADDFGRGIKRMIAACTGQAVELKRIPFDLVSRTVQANDAQRNALEQVHSAANDAAETFRPPVPRTFLRSLASGLISLAAH